MPKFIFSLEPPLSIQFRTQSDTEKSVGPQPISTNSVHRLESRVPAKYDWGTIGQTTYPDTPLER